MNKKSKITEVPGGLMVMTWRSHCCSPGQSLDWKLRAHIEVLQMAALLPAKPPPPKQPKNPKIRTVSIVNFYLCKKEKKKKDTHKHTYIHQYTYTNILVSAWNNSERIFKKLVTSI